MKTKNKGRISEAKMKNYARCLSKAKSNPYNHITFEFFRLIYDENLDEMRRFMRDGFDPNTRNESGLTCLMVACMHRKVAAAVLLIGYGADVNLTDMYGKNALTYSLIEGEPRLVRHILPKFRGDLEKELLFASVFSRPKELTLLINAGADVNARDNLGCTPLILSAKNNKMENAAVLLQHGADINAQDADGMTAFIHACVCGHYNMAEFLRKMGAHTDIPSKIMENRRLIEYLREKVPPQLKTDLFNI